MITDNFLALATAEAPPNAGASPGGLGEASVNLALDLGTSHDVAGIVRSDPGVSEVEMEIQVDTSFTAAEPTEGDGFFTFELVSMPILLSKLSDGSGGATDGKRTHIAGVVTTIATDTFTVTAHGLLPGTPIYLSALATTTGLSTNTIYYVAANGLAADTFKICTTRAAALDSSGTVVDLLTGNGTATVEFYPFIHASTGRIPMAALQAGARFAVRLSPYSIDATAATAYGSAAGKPTTNPGFLPICGRYLALQVRPENCSSTVGRYTASLGINMQSGQRHFATASTITL